ncbi:MAG TPA: lytic transglycosylase domain-containing protein [Bryobacteraceae bacterium]|nr:lytic transglycosylase domain-containing protein [Bryobacteraceae bacterium]
MTHGATFVAILLCAGAVPAAGQSAAAAMEQSIAKQRASFEKQQASFEKQRASIQKQVPTGGDSADPFFSTAWKDHMELPPVPLYRPPECDPVPDDQIDPIVEEISAREGLTPDLLHAVIERESAYLPCALSYQGAQGLMQLMPATAASLGVKDPFDARQNVDGGARLLKKLIDRYGGNLVLGLAAYNAGPARVDLAGGVPNLPETLQYVSAIMARLGLNPTPEITAH